MSVYIAFPKINSVLFYQSDFPERAFENTIPTHEQQLRYHQKVEQTDTIPVLFWTNAGPQWTLAASLIDCYGNEIITYSIATVSQGVTASYDLNKFSAVFGNMDEGVYQIRITAESDQADSYVFLSEPIHMRASWDDTIWIDYYNEVNDFDIPFEDMNTFMFGLRVEGGWESGGYSPQAKDTIYLDQNHTPVMLDSIPYVVRKLTIGEAYGIPNWLANIINRAFSCTHTYIDSTRYVKNEGAKLEPSRTSNYPLAGWMLDLLEVDETLSNEITQSYVFVLGYGGNYAFQMGTGDDGAVSPAKHIYG